MGTIAEKLAYLKATKEAIKDAIKAKGQTVSDTLPFRSYANKISAIETGSKPTITVSSSGLITATSGNFSNTKQLTTQGAQTITPGTSAKTIASGRYLTGTQTIAGDSDLVASNIKKGVEIFGVTGTMQPFRIDTVFVEEYSFDAYSMPLDLDGRPSEIVSITIRNNTQGPASEGIDQLIIYSGIEGVAMKQDGAGTRSFEYVMNLNLLAIDSANYRVTVTLPYTVTRDFGSANQSYTATVVYIATN